jgi:hypothetical protein
VVRPTDDGVGLDGEDDEVHLGFAAAHGLAIITKNRADFQALHDLDQRHSGIFAVYQDNDPSRDMSNADIVRRSETSKRQLSRAVLRFRESSTRSTIGGIESVSRRHRRGSKKEVKGPA